MVPVQTIFSGFEQPFLDSAVGLLAGLAEQGRVPDLSGCLCVVPTAEAGRRLRAALAQHFSASGGVIPPGTVLPLGLLGEGDTACEGEIFAAWLKTLNGPAIRQASSLLHNWDQKNGSGNVLLHIAEKLQQTRMTLAGAGISLQDAADTLDSLCRTEAAALENFCRFSEFLLLEKAYLRNLGKIDPAQRLLENAAAFPGEEKRHIIVLGCPDAPEIFYPALEKAAKSGLPVTILVDGEDDGSFDGLGRPVTEKWLHRSVAYPVDRVRRFSSAQEESLWVVQTLEKGFYPSVIGVLGDELPGALRDNLMLKGKTVRFPGELPLASSGFGSLFQALFALMSPGASYAALAGLIRHGLFLAYAAHQKIAPGSLLGLLDKIKSDYLAVTAEQFLARSGEYAPETVLLRYLMTELGEAGRSESPLRSLYGIFARIGEAAASDLTDRVRAAAELDALGALVVEAESAAGGDAALAGLLFSSLLKKRLLRIEEDADTAVSAAGFLELAFSGEQDLLLCGFNEENFKRGGDSDAFLPENARKAVGMRSSEDRYAADVARFEALVRHRACCGSLTISCAKTSCSGDALMPARLLFQCGEEELPGRVSLIFQGELDRRMPRTAPEEMFSPFFIRSAPPKKRISVTSFAAYLRCPFRFYLEHVLDAGESDDLSCEFDASHYGTIAHSILERTLRLDEDLTEAEEIEAAALAELAKEKRIRFGQFSPGVSLLQFEAIGRNLHYFAKIEAELRQSGWQTMVQEYPLRMEWEKVFAAFFPHEPAEAWRAGIELTGQIDRIDCHAAKKIIRVIDYKTYREPKTPEKTHLKRNPRLMAGDFAAAWEQFQWTDLQLPLYLALLRAASSLPFYRDGMTLESAYFNLPLAAADTGLALFKSLNSDERLSSAVRCADQCLHRICAERQFWPPGKAAGAEDVWSGFFGSMEQENFLLPEDWKVKR